MDEMIKNVEKLDLNDDKNRKFLVDCCRQLDQIYHNKVGHCNPNTDSSFNLIDEIMHHSLFVQPYITGHPVTDPKDQSLYQLTYFSKCSQEEFLGQRKCNPPRLRIDG